MGQGLADGFDHTKEELSGGLGGALGGALSGALQGETLSVEGHANRDETKKKVREGARDGATKGLRHGAKDGKTKKDGTAMAEGLLDGLHDGAPQIIKEKQRWHD